MKYYLLAAGLLLTGSAQAQVRFGVGPQVGYTLATAKYTRSSYTVDTRYRSGFAAGLLAEVGVGHLFIRPAALFTEKGIDFTASYIPVTITKYSYDDSHNRINYLVIPLNIGYTQHSDGQGVQVFGGAYFGLALGGRYNDDITYALLSSGSTPSQRTVNGQIVAGDNTSTGSYTRRVRAGDFGVQGGVGYRYKGLLAQLEYSWGLRNVDPDNSGGTTYPDTPVYYNRVFQFSLAYLFGSKS